MLLVGFGSSLGQIQELSGSILRRSELTNCTLLGYFSRVADWRSSLAAIRCPGKTHVVRPGYQLAVGHARVPHHQIKVLGGDIMPQPITSP